MTDRMTWETDDIVLLKEGELPPPPEVPYLAEQEPEQ